MQASNSIIAVFADHHGADAAIRVLAALGAALYGRGIPRNTVIACKNSIKADGFLVTIPGPAEELARAKAILAAGNPDNLMTLVA